MFVVNVSKLVSITVLLGLLSGTSGSMVPAEDVTFAQVAKATKIFFRDSAEFPMRITVDLTVVDPSGRIRKHKSGKVSYDFHGFNSRSGNANARMRGPKNVMKAASSIAISSFVSTSLLAPDAEKYYAFTLNEPVDPGLISVRMAPIPACEPIKWSTNEYLPEGLCGPISVQLNNDDLSLQRFVFDASGLPASVNIDPFGMATVSRFYVEAMFQKVMIADDPKPFLVPKVVTVTLETDKGKLVIAGAYAPRK
jgi:hypothetical protein